MDVMEIWGNSGWVTGNSLSLLGIKLRCHKARSPNSEDELIREPQHLETPVSRKFPWWN